MKKFFLLSAAFLFSIVPASAEVLTSEVAESYTKVIVFPLTLEWVEEESSPRKPISTFGRKKRKRRPQGLLRLIK